MMNRRYHAASGEAEAIPRFLKQPLGSRTPTVRSQTDDDGVEVLQRQERVEEESGDGVPDDTQTTRSGEGGGQSLILHRL